MKRLGLIGGVSPESTEVYVRHLNRLAREKLGGEHSANFIVWHLDYGVMVALYHARDWDGYSAQIVKAGEGLKRAGAEALMIGSNTSHLAADALAGRTGLTVIHILDALAAAMNEAAVGRPLLLGTPVTMSGDYYLPALGKRYSGAPIVPGVEEQREIGRIIFDELALGVVADASRKNLLTIIDAHKDADAVILGCTELSLILSQKDSALPVFDTTALHAAAGSAFAFGG